MERWFTKEFRERDPQTVAWISRCLRRLRSMDISVAARPCATWIIATLLPSIKTPTLVIIGKYDTGTVPEAGEYIRDNIPQARSSTLDAAHLSNVENRAQFNDAALRFLLEK